MLKIGRICRRFPIFRAQKVTFVVNDFTFFSEKAFFFVNKFTFFSEKAFFRLNIFTFFSQTVSFFTNIASKCGDKTLDFHDAEAVTIKTVMRFKNKCSPSAKVMPFLTMKLP